MLSPFPGMDPYLEAPSLWPNVHQRLVTYAADSLGPQVRPRYWVQIGERVYVSEPLRSVFPDVSLTERRPPVRQPQAGGTTLAQAPDTPVVLMIPSTPIREVFLEIRDVRSGHVVTVIEVLSPTNKASGEGQDLYLEKQRQVLASDASLVEVDLLRRGEPTVAVPAELLESLPAYHYLVCVSRPDNRRQFETYPTTVRERLPRVGIPLRAGEADVLLDLPALLSRAYDNGAYADVLDYTQDPDPPFGGDHAEWVRSVARSTNADDQTSPGDPPG
jgi:hypothetical protein